MAEESRAVAVAEPKERTLLGFGTQASFEYTQRAAKALAASTLVPEAFRSWVVNKKSSDKELVDNPNAVPNCIIALNMSQRMGADPLMIMQNLYIVEGRPSWSSQFVIACINACGRFSPLRFDISEPSPTPTEVEYEVGYWENRQKKYKKVKQQVFNRTCRAWVVEKASGERLDGPEVSMAMAVLEGWFGKQGSKWQTMPEMMLRYRAASFFGRLYAPELLMGLHTDDEVRDAYDTTAEATPLLAGPIPPMPTRGQFTDVEEGGGSVDGEEGDGEHVDPETGEVSQGGGAGGGAVDGGQPSLGLGDGGPGKPVNYFIPVPMREGADKKKVHDWMGWAELVKAALPGLASRAEVDLFREKNRPTVEALFRADPGLASDVVADIAEREDALN